MFAPPVAKPKSVPPQPLAATAHRPDQAAVAHRQLSQETIGNRTDPASLPIAAMLSKLREMRAPFPLSCAGTSNPQTHVLAGTADVIR